LLLVDLTFEFDAARYGEDSIVKQEMILTAHPHTVGRRAMAKPTAYLSHDLCM
jgi:hypothetical protein